jgi:outer membrane protein W
MKLNAMTLHASATIFLLSVLTNLACAEEINLSKWYVNATVGASLINDPNADYMPDSGARKGKLNVDNGILFGGGVGYFLMPDIRLEGEVVYRSNDVSSSSITGFSSQGGADIASVMYMANVYKDFDLFSTSFANFKPYIGLGVGRNSQIKIVLHIKL